MIDQIIMKWDREMRRYEMLVKNLLKEQQEINDVLTSKISLVKQFKEDLNELDVNSQKKPKDKNQ